MFLEDFPLLSVIYLDFQVKINGQRKTKLFHLNTFSTCSRHVLCKTKLRTLSVVLFAIYLNILDVCKFFHRGSYKIFSFNLQQKCTELFVGVRVIFLLCALHISLR